MPKGGKRPGAGNPGYGKQIAVREGVERLTPRWFAMVEEMLNAKPDDTFTKEIKELATELIKKDSYYGKEIIKFLARGAIEDRKFALDQLGKLMGKMMPTEVTGKDGGPLQFEWLSQSLTNQEDGRKRSTVQVSAG
jgi:hypothetical protein